MIRGGLFVIQENFLRLLENIVWRFVQDCCKIVLTILHITACIKGGIVVLEALREDYEDPVMFGPKQLVSSSKLVRNLSSYLDMAQRNPIFVARDQEVEAVLISLEDYRELLREEEKVEELYHAVVALRRLVEHHQTSGQLLLTSEAIAEAIGLPGDVLTEVGGIGADD